MLLVETCDLDRSMLPSCTLRATGVFARCNMKCLHCPRLVKRHAAGCAACCPHPWGLHPGQRTESRAFGHSKPNPASYDWTGCDVVATSGFALAACLTWVCPRLRVVTLPYSHGWDMVDQDLISARPKRVCVHQVHEQVRPSGSYEKPSLPCCHRMHRRFAVSSLKYTDALNGLGNVQVSLSPQHCQLTNACTLQK